MKYRLAIDLDNPDQPHIIDDPDGDTKLIVMLELLHYHQMRALDHHRRAQRVIDDIATEVRQARGNNEGI